MTLQNFMYALVPIADAVMLVNLNQDAMSAVSLASQVMFVFNLFVYAVFAGTNMFAAQYMGKGDTRAVEKVLGYSLRLIVPCAIAFFCCAFFFPEGVMRIYTSEEAIIPHGIRYLRIAAFSYLLMGISETFSSILTNTGLVKYCTAINVCMVLLNIVLNATFIYGLGPAPAMGSAGAALATVIAEALALISILIVSYAKCPAKFRIKNCFNTEWEYRHKFSTYVSPYLANQLIWGVAFTIVSVIIGHLESDAVAANSIAVVVKDLVSCFCYALGAGGAIMVGNELGAGRLDTAKKYGDILCKLTVVSGIVLGLLVACLSSVIAYNVNLTDTAAEYLRVMLLMCSYYILGRSINSTVISGIFAAGGDTKFGLICDALTMWGFIIPAGALAAFVFKWPVLVVYFILNLDEMVKVPAVFIHYRKYRWLKNLVSEE